MQRPTADRGGTFGYGVGWLTNENKLGYRSLGHTGGMGGVNTGLELIPSGKLAVVALANGNTDLPWVVTEEILSALLPEYAARRAEQQAREKAEKEAIEREPKPEPSFAPSPELLGEWNGAVHTYQGEVPLKLVFKESGDVHAQLGTQLKTLLNDAKLEDGRLTGQMFGDLGTEDTRRLPHHLHADLKLRGEVLNGSLIALSLPAPRSGYALSHWVELKKAGRRNGS
jgi:hypothetical protein